MNNYRAAREMVRADEQTVQDAKDLIVLATGGAICKPLRPERVWNQQRRNSKRANLAKQTQERRQTGLVAQIDVSTSQVQEQTQKQRIGDSRKRFREAEDQS